jgi:hypothetical protein
LQWKVLVPGAAWGVNISGNGKVAVAALAEGTIRWYRIEDGKELLAFFPHKDGKRWVLWTPSGYYATSRGADELIGWHLNHGKDQTPDFFPASRFRSVYYRPEVTAKVLSTLNEAEAIRLAGEEAQRKPQEVAIEEMLPPVVTVLSPQDGTGVTSSEVTVRYVVHMPSGEPVTVVKFLVDGRPIPRERAIRRKDKDIQEGEAYEEVVKIPEQDCELSVIAENRYAASEPAVVKLLWRGD